MILAWLFNNGKFTEKCTGFKMCVFYVSLQTVTTAFPLDELKKYEKTYTGIQVSHTLLSFHFNKKWYSYSYKTSKNVSLNVILLYCYLHSLRYQQIQLIYWLLDTIPNPHML